MAEEVKNVNQVQNQKKDFTNKSQKTEIKQEVKQEIKQEIKLEKADPKFNHSIPEQKIQSIPNLKVNEVEVDFDMAVKSESSKVEVKKEKISGEVISVSKYDYIVKTKDGKGVLIIGEHDKKIGDII